MKTLAFSIILILSYSATGQTYNVEVIQSPYMTLEGGQPLVLETWSEPVFSAPIGFDFPFFDDVIDTLFAQDFFAGGYLSTSLDYDSTGILNFFSTALIDRGFELDSTISPIVYKLEGDVGHRVFTLEYKNAGFYFGEVSEEIYTDYINIQIRLREESGAIEVHIGPYFVQNPELNFEGLTGPTIGLLEDFNFEDGVITGELIILAGDPSSPDVITDISPDFLEWPIPENTVYIFSRVGTGTEISIDEEMPQFYFPNPASDFISLHQKYYGTIISPVSIINSIGQNVTTTEVVNTIDLNNFETGLYYLSFQTKNGPVIQKISISK